MVTKLADPRSCLQTLLLTGPSAHCQGPSKPHLRASGFLVPKCQCDIGLNHETLAGCGGHAKGSQRDQKRNKEEMKTSIHKQRAHTCPKSRSSPDFHQLING